MKRLNYHILVVAGLLTLTMSCDMSVEPPAQIAKESYWNTENDAFLNLNACYAQMPGFDIHDELSTDNAHSHKPWEGPFELIQQDGMSTEHNQGYSFTGVRLFNDFIKNVETVQTSDDMKARMRAEVRFLRAFAYLNLTSKFGKVPVITDVLPYDAELLDRDPVEKVRKFVLDELEQVAAVLPRSYNGGFLQEKSRITKGAAWALRARAALYFDNFAEAERSAKAVMDLGIYDLFKINSLNAAQEKEAVEMEQYIDFVAKGIDKDAFIKGMFSYSSLWHDANANASNPEYILTREYMEHDSHSDWGRYIYIRPSQLVQGYSSFEPMQDLIDAYWDIDGKTIRTMDNESRKAAFNSFNAAIAQLKPADYGSVDVKSFDYMKEFRNRDARLYASILFPLKGWHETDGGTFYYKWDPKWFNTNGNESWTGFSYRKMVSLTPYQDQKAFEDYPTIRYAEVLLTFAEARVKNTGWDQQAQTAVNGLRERLGMPKAPSSLTADQALDFIRNERRIELAGEGHRYEDMRRYGDAYAKKAMTGPTYTPDGQVVVNKAWSNRLMLMPIPQSAIDLNAKLKSDQNPGYN